VQPYSSYKPTGIDWIGDIPSHWGIKRLKYIALVQPSNVDKRIEEDETPVLLCNYMDVYKNEFIDETLKFSQGSVSQNEIEKFKIKKGDVLVTKDSETPDDIANPAYVRTDFENVICAYHLTQIRPDKKELLGSYLFRLFQENKFKAQFEVAANGVTRFGLSTEAFTDAFIPLPTLEEQTVIANFIDEKTIQIDRLISNKQKLIELLQEEKRSIITEAINKGINQRVKLRSTKLDSINVPEHWTISSVGYISKVVRGASPRPAGAPQYFNGDHTPWITVGEVTKDESKFITDVSEYLTEEGAKQSRFVEIGTLLLSNSGATLGVPKILHIGGCINDGSVAFLNLSKKIVIHFLYYFFKSLTVIYREQMRGYGQPNLNTDIVKGTQFCYPSIEEQIEIVNHIERQLEKTVITISKIEKEIALMNEYRTALISEVVTGKIKVA
jgi:type I restriction enzyme S subunit